MCGIFAVHGQLNNQAPAVTLAGLKRLEYRGYDSWGIASTRQNGQIKVIKRAGKIGPAAEGLVKRLSRTSKNSSHISIGHTRWATHGGVSQTNAHPHLSCQKRFAVIHNGIIDNFLDLKKMLTRKGHIFSSQTDTEVMAHLLEELPFFDAFNKLSGLNAIVALDSQTQTLWAAKTGSPLVVGFAKDTTYLASDPSALLPHTRHVYFLADGQGAQIKANQVAIFDLSQKKKIAFRRQRLSWTAKQARLSGFEHYLLKEISEQPELLKKLAGPAGRKVRALSKAIKNSYGAYFIGAGTAYHAGIAGVYLLDKIAHRHINHLSASEFTSLSGFITRGSLVIALTQSGETIDVVEALKNAKTKGATLSALTNVTGSTVDRMVSLSVPLQAGPEKSVLATKSYLAMVAQLLLIAHDLAGRFVLGQKKLLTCARKLKTLLQEEKIVQLKRLARRLKSAQHLYLLGRGQSLVDALEGALKIKEVSYIHAEGFAGGDLKHGSIALVEKGTPIIVFAPPDKTYKAIISNAMEVKARGAFVIGVSPKRHPVFDHFISTPEVGPASNLVNIMPIQLLAYYLALERGCDPDKPRNLAKSVTVR